MNIPTGTEGVVWSIMRGESLAARAVDPGPLGIVVPDDVLDYAATHHGYGADPDVYLLVTPRDQAGEVLNEIDCVEDDLPSADVDLIRAVLAADEARSVVARELGVTDGEVAVPDERVSTTTVVVTSAWQPSPGVSDG